jgi:RHS repeat-associated protein
MKSLFSRGKASILRVIGIISLAIATANMAFAQQFVFPDEPICAGDDSYSVVLSSTRRIRDITWTISPSAGTVTSVVNTTNTSTAQIHWTGTPGSSVAIQVDYEQESLSGFNWRDESLTKIVWLTSLPSFSSFNGPSKVNLNAANTFSFEGSNSASSFQWFVDGVLNTTTSTPSASISFPATGNHVLEGRLINVCNQYTSSTIPVSVCPELDLHITGGHYYCTGGSLTLTANVTDAASGYTYKWLKDNVEVSNSTSPNYVVSQDGVYSVTVTTPDGCSATTGPYSVSSNDPPTAISEVRGLKMNFVNEPSLLEVIGSDDATTFTWSVASGQSAAFRSVGPYEGKKVYVIPTEVGIYSLKVVPKKNGCEGTPFIVTYEALSAALKAEQFIKGYNLANTEGYLFLPKHSTNYKGCISQFGPVTVNVGLDMGDNYNLGSNAFTASAKVKVTAYSDLPGTDQSWEFTLTIDQTAPEQFFSKTITVQPELVKFIKVTVDNNATVSTIAAQKVIRLKAFYEESGDVVSVNNLKVSPRDASQDLNHLTWEQTFSWLPPCLDVNNYLFEIMKVYDSEGIDFSKEESWKNALKIQTENGSTSLTLAMAEGSGTYFWRVKPLGNAPGGIANPANWSNEMPFIRSFEYKHPEEGKNWIYSRTFTDGNKITEQITYANGLQQLAQQQTRIQGENQVVAIQTIQDYVGRNAISSLPIPVAGLTSLGYVNGLLRNGTNYDGDGDVANNRVYSAADFDGKIPDPAIDLGGYYTATNTNNNKNEGVASAEGYPFSQTIYTADGTGRVREQAGVGFTHSIKGGKTVQTFYTKATESELVNLFGSEAPDHRSVQKVVTYDANGIASISFQTKDGKVIATALGLTGSTGSLSQVTSPAPTEKTFFELARGNERADDITVVSRTPLFLTKTGSVKIDYQLNPGQIMELCGASSSDHVANFPLQGNVNDISGHNNHGTATAVTLAQDAFEDMSAYSFNGTSSYIGVNDGPDLDFGDRDFSVSFWVYKQANVANWVNSAGVSKWSSATVAGINEWGLLLSEKGTDNTPCFSIESLNVKYSAVSSEALLLNTWYHLAGVREGNELKIYINGELRGTKTLPAGVKINNAALPLYIGRFGTVYTKGIFDDVQIFSRALDAGEVKYLLQRGTICRTCDYTVSIRLFKDGDSAPTDVVAPYAIEGKECSAYQSYRPSSATVTLTGGVNYVLEKRLILKNKNVLGQQYIDLHLQAVEADYRDQINARLQTINGYIDQYKYAQLYTYLESIGGKRSETENNQYIVPLLPPGSGGCQEYISIPVVEECPVEVVDENTCKMNGLSFEEYFKTYYQGNAEITPVVSGKLTYLYFNNQYPGAEKKIYFPEGHFDAMVANLKTDNPALTCSILWRVWAQQVKAYEAKIKFSSSTGSNEAQDLSNFATVIPTEYSLFDDFLSAIDGELQSTLTETETDFCDNNRYIQKKTLYGKIHVNSVAGTATVTTRDLVNYSSEDPFNIDVRYAYRLVYFNTDVLNMKNALRFYAGITATPPALPAEPTLDHFRSLSPCNKYRLSRSTNFGDQGYNQTTEQEVDAVIQSEIGKMRVKCGEACEGRAEEFRQAIINGLFKANTNTVIEHYNVYKNGTYYLDSNPNQLSAKIYTGVLDKTANQSGYTVSECELDAMVQAMIENCRNNYCNITLTEQLKTDRDTGAPVKVYGTEEEIEKFMMPVTHDFEVQINQSCDNSWNIINGPVDASPAVAKWAKGTIDFTSFGVDKQGNAVLVTDPDGDSPYVDKLIKVSPSGQVLWEKKLWDRGSGGAWIVDVKVDNANNIIIVGTYGGIFDVDPSSAEQWIGFPDKRCFFIAKFNASGDFVNANFESGQLNNIGELNFDIDNNIYLNGYGSNLDVNFSSASAVVTGPFIAKYSASLEYQWSKQVGTITDVPQAGIEDVAVLTNGYVVVIGGYDYSKRFISKLDGSGNLIWSKNFISSDYVIMRMAIGKNNSIHLYGGLSGQMDADPGISVTFLSGIGNTYVIKLSDNGDYLWSNSFSGHLSDGEMAYDAVSDEIVLGGKADGEFDLDLSEEEYKLSQFPYGYFVARYTADFELIKESVHTIPGNYMDETVDEVTAVGGYTFLSGFNVGSFSETPVPAGWFVVKAGDPHCTFTPTFCFRFTNSRVTPVVVPNGLQDYTFKAEEIPCRDVAASVLRNSINQQVEQVISRRVESFKDLYYHTCGDPSMIDDKMTLSYTEGIYQYTLYYYDRAGNLIRTVPPEGVVQSAAPLTTEAEVAAVKAYPRPHTLVTEYQYNALGQLIREHSPDANFELENADLYKKPSYIITNNLAWSVIDAVNVTGSSVIKPGSASTAWNAGAISEESILNDGYVEWRFTGSARSRVMGLCQDTDETDITPANINYGLSTLLDGRVIIYEKGTQVGAAVGNYLATDKFSVERIGDKIYYKKNGVKIGESSVSSSGPLHVGCAIYNALGSIEEIVFSNVPSGKESEKELADIVANQAINESRYYATYIYNDKGQIRFSRNAKQKKEGTFSYTKYDELGRVIEVGESTVYDEAALMANRNAVGRSEFPTEGRRFVTSSYFNDPYINIGGEETALPTGYLQNKNNLRNRISYTYLDKDALDNTLDDRTYTIYNYDPHGNVDWLVQTIPGIPAVAMKYDYDLISGKVTQVSYNPGKRDEFYHRYGYDANNRLSTVKTSKEGHLWETEARYTYYLHGPVKRAVIGEDLVQGIDYTYTIHGWLKGLNHQLVDKNSDPGQDAVGSSVIGRDAFGMALGYYAGDYKGTYKQFEVTNTSNLQAYQGKNLYNGNISTWSTGILYPAASGIAYPVTANAYTYDVLNRITGSIMHTYSNGAYTKTDSYGSTYTYKGNGNLEFVKNYRDGGLVMDNLKYEYYTGTNRLSHVVESAGASPVTNDVEIQESQNYKYDAIGNLVIDETQKTMISWNSYGKVERVDKFTVDAADQKVLTGANTSFIYDAAGNRVAKRRINATGLSVTDYYVRDASGNVMATYEKTEQVGSTSETILNELYIYEGNNRLGAYNRAISINGVVGETPLESGETRIAQNTIKTQYEHVSYLINVGSELTLGAGFVYSAGTGGDDFIVRVVATGNTAELTSDIYTRSLNSRHYELKDHLGNVRVVLTDLKLSTLISNEPGDYHADLTGTYNYYSFGMDITGRSWFANAKYRYGFNGKEKDDNGEFGDIQYDYGFRIYNPAIGRFLSVDPLTASYPSWSPYPFAMNSPIAGVDLDGLEFYYAADGKYLGVGTDEKSQDVYKADKKNEDGTYLNATKLDVTHDQFNYISGVVSKEDASTFKGAAATTQATFNAVKLVKGEDTSMADQSKFANELLATGYSSVPSKASLTTADVTTKANNARAGLIHVLSGGTDYSEGAVAWDGVDFAIKGSTHPKGKDGGFSISEALWTKFIATYNWCDHKEKGILYKNVYYPNPPELTFTDGVFDKEGTGKWTKGNVVYKASAVYGQHVFWKPNKEDSRNKGYIWSGMNSFLKK